MVFILISTVWLVFRKDIAGYQHQIVSTMFGKLRPEQEQERLQRRAMESLGTAFSVLLLLAGVLLLTLNLVL